ncbi:MAG: 2-deoxyglucose-6-phosphatase [Thalassobius sp.]|nr:2-deoxyglucose-6-phosphatase [Thalassovita sp.]
MTLKAAIFDMDGLLVDSEPLWRSSEIRSFATVGVHLTPEVCKQTMGLRIEEAVQHWYNKFPWEGTSIEEVKKDIFDEFMKEVEATAVPMDGVVEILEFFKGKGLKIGLASSSPMLLIKKIVKHLKIDSYFEILHTAEDQKYGKPHPAVYIETAIDLGVKPQECIALEDSFMGMISALAARMKTIVVPEPENFDNPKFGASHIKLASLKEFNEAMYEQLSVS